MSEAWWRPTEVADDEDDRTTPVGSQAALERATHLGSDNDDCRSPRGTCETGHFGSGKARCDSRMSVATDSCQIMRRAGLNLTPTLQRAVTCATSRRAHRE